MFKGFEVERMNKNFALIGEFLNFFNILNENRHCKFYNFLIYYMY